MVSSQTNSSQVASADVLGRRILLFSECTNPLASEEEKGGALDKMMNELYQAVRSVLSPERFARVKEEQKAWLKLRTPCNQLRTNRS
jgi:uncharacterized protein YecT (DUF1311 family)